jgi:hypothetical protein
MLWAAGLYCAALALLIVGTMEFVTNSFASFVLVRLALPATGCQPPSTCGPVRTAPRAHNAPHPAAPAAAAVLPALSLSPSTYLLALPALPCLPAPALPLLCPACLQDRNDNSGTLIAIQWLIIGSLILTGICDLAAAYIVLAANKPTFTIWRWRCVGG